MSTRIEKRFISTLLRRGQAATVAVKSYTACPCTASNFRGEYSEEWHRENPGETDCGGTGSIGSATTYNIKGTFFDIATLSTGDFLKDIILTQIGKDDKSRLGGVGFVNTDTEELISFADLTENSDVLTLNSQDYIFTKVIPLQSVQEVGEFVLLEPVE